MNGKGYQKVAAECWNMQPIQTELSRTSGATRVASMKLLSKEGNQILDRWAASLGELASNILGHHRHYEICRPFSVTHDQVERIDSRAIYKGSDPVVYFHFSLPLLEYDLYTFEQRAWPKDAPGSATRGDAFASHRISGPS